MLENIEVLCHSSIRINKEKVIYIDPFKIDKNYNDADIIFITHDHYDHYSEEDIDKVKKEDTIIVAPEELLIHNVEVGFITKVGLTGGISVIVFVTTHPLASVTVIMYLPV